MKEDNANYYGNKIPKFFRELRYDNEWDSHIDHNYLYIDLHNEYLGSIVLNEKDDTIIIQSFYVNEIFRKCGYGKIIFERALNIALCMEPKEIYLLVRKDNFIKKMYKKMGFKRYKDKIDDGIKYEWMIFNKK